MMRLLVTIMILLLTGCTGLKPVEGVHEFGCDLSGISYKVMDEGLTELKCHTPNVIIMCKTKTLHVSGSIYTCEDSDGKQYKVLDKTTQDAKVDEYLESLGY